MARAKLIRKGRNARYRTTGSFGRCRRAGDGSCGRSESRGDCSSGGSLELYLIFRGRSGDRVDRGGCGSGSGGSRGGLELSLRSCGRSGDCTLEGVGQSLNKDLQCQQDCNYRSRSCTHAGYGHLLDLGGGLYRRLRDGSGDGGYDRGRHDLGGGADHSLHDRLDDRRSMRTTLSA